MSVRGVREETTRLREFSYVILGYVEMYTEGVHGYRLGRMLSQSPLGLSPLRLGQVYRALRGLERAALVRSQLESGGPRPARYRYLVTREGAEAFRRWVTHLGGGAASVRERLLNRLRFVDRLAPDALRSLLAEAISECEAELQTARRHATRGRRREPAPADMAALPGAAGAPGLHALLLQARIAGDRHWLDEVGRVIERLYGRTDPPAARVSASAVA
jgi:DNA-binding PadR family transcriptional regulator